MPPDNHMVAVLKGYGDDSRSQKIWTIGGYLAPDGYWANFERLWKGLLIKHDVPYFHMKEMGKQNGVYKKWQPREGHQAELMEFFSDLTTIICDTRIRGFFCITRLDDLRRFNEETRLNLEPYPLTAYGCVLAVANELGYYETEIIFDHVEKVHSKLAQAHEYLTTDGNYGRYTENITTIPLAKSITFRQLLPLQAADFITWEVQKHHLKNADEWFSLPNKPLGEIERDNHFREWSRNKHGRDYPIPRKSLNALMVGAQPVSSMVWDYDNLCRANELRGGIWSA
jgi:hypothetical protein